MLKMYMGEWCQFMSHLHMSIYGPSLFSPNSDKDDVLVSAFSISEYTPQNG